MRAHSTPWFILLVVILAACNLTTQPSTDEPIDVPTINPGGKPVVTITSPEQGDEFVVGEALFVTANARDAVGVTRVQLIANDQIVKTISSESASGQTNFEVLLDYTPREEGDVTLQIVAYRGAIASDPAEVTINIRANQAQVTATAQTQPDIPVIDPNDPTCRLLTNVGLRLRTGPGVSFNQITVLNAGTVAPIIGRTGTNDWYQIQYGTRIGWVASQNPGNPNEKYVSLYGICSNVPIIAPTATPTLFPSLTPFPTWTFTPQPTAAPQPSATPGLPDLVITSIAGETSVTIPEGSTEAVRQYAITITNNSLPGSRSTGTFNNKVILPGGLEADLGAVSGLDAGTSIVLTVNVTFSAAGNYEIRAIADTDNSVTEFSEVNNSGSLSVTVTGP
ncbi:MAG: SH3 domain-containing protein [Chloroflexi bacterium]|nr:SH3 domain-containing protein [Chloroflexota bacterium]